MKPVVLISTTFFPHPAVGGIRTTRLASHLPEFGYKPIVVTRWYGHEATRELIEKHLHPDVEVIYLDRPKSTAVSSAPSTSGTRGFSPLRRLRSRVGRVLSPLTVPDIALPLWRGWTPAIRQIIERVRPVAYCTSSPPFSTHAVGLSIRPALPTPWIASYEDPYLIDPRFGPRGVRALRAGAHRAFDRSVHRTADIVLHTIPVQARWSSLAYPAFRGKNRLITMGSPVELVEAKVNPAKSRTGAASVRIVGFIGDDPAMSLARAIRTLGDRGLDVELGLIGREPANLAQIKELLGDRVTATGFVRHDEALRQVSGADVLVSYLTPERAAVYGLSSKLFEYLAVGKPVLAINPTFSDRHFLSQFPFAMVLKDPGPEAITEAIAALLQDPARRPPPGFAAAFGARNSWREKTRDFAGILDELAARTPDAARSH